MFLCSVNKDRLANSPLCFGKWYEHKDNRFHSIMVIGDFDTLCCKHVGQVPTSFPVNKPFPLLWHLLFREDFYLTFATLFIFDRILSNAHESKRGNHKQNLIHKFGVNLIFCDKTRQIPSWNNVWTCCLEIWMKGEILVVNSCI